MHEKGISNISGRKGDIVPSHTSPNPTQGEEAPLYLTLSPLPQVDSITSQQNIPTDHSNRTWQRNIPMEHDNGTSQQNILMDHSNKTFYSVQVQ
jgi:hypothetical protein